MALYWAKLHAMEKEFKDTLTSLPQTVAAIGYGEDKDSLEEETWYLDAIDMLTKYCNPELDIDPIDKIRDALVELTSAG